MSGSKPRKIKGCCGGCGRWKGNGKDHCANWKHWRKLGVKRRIGNRPPE